MRWSLAMITAIKIAGSGKWMYLRCGPFLWSWRCAGCRYNTEHIAWWIMTRALDSAISWLLALYCPGGRHGDNKQNNDAECTHFAGHFNGHRSAAILYRFMALLKATKRQHRTSTCSDITQSDMPTPVVSDISSWKRAPVDMLAPNNNRGMTNQTDEKHWTIFPEFFVGVVK